MKKLLFVFTVSAAAIACGPSSGNSSGNDIDVISSPTGDTAITDHGTGAAKGAEANPDSTRTDTTSNP